MKALFLAPLLCWMLGLYQCLKVVKTEELRLYRHSPAAIRQKLGELAKEKQRELDLAFYWMLGGLLAAGDKRYRRTQEAGVRDPKTLPPDSRPVHHASREGV